MSNFSDFFGSAAAGGIGQTITVGDISYPNARPVTDIKVYTIYQGSNGSNNNYAFLDFNSNEPGWYYTTGSGANSDWKTVADITSSSNGGGVYGAINYFSNASADHTSRAVEFRITLDGTATTWASSTTRNNYNYGISYLGPLANVNMYYITNSGYGGIGPIDGYQAASQGDSGSVPSFSWNSTAGTYENNSAAGSRTVYWNKEPSILWGKKAQPYMYFSSTCKVEMKTNRDNAQDQYWAGIKLF